MKKVYVTKKGITLIELLVAIGIFGIVIVITGGILNYSSKFYVKSNQNLKGASESRIATSYVVNKLREYETLDSVKLEDHISNLKEYGAIKFETSSNPKSSITIKLENADGKKKLIEIFEEYNLDGTLKTTSKSTIANVEGFSISKVLKDNTSDPKDWDKRTLKITIKYKNSSSTEQEISTIINRKCEVKSVN